MKNILLALIFAVASFAAPPTVELFTIPFPSLETNDVTIHTITDLSGTYFQEPRPTGILVLVADSSPETTHFVVTVEYSANGNVRSETFTRYKVYQQNGPTFTTMFFNTGQQPTVLRVTAFAFRCTGFRTVAN